jgi:hypothetical protein
MFYVADLVYSSMNCRLLDYYKASSGNLMFVPCIAGLRVQTNTVHWVLSIYVYCYAAPTCFGTYVPSSGSVFVLVSYVKTKAFYILNVTDSVLLCYLLITYSGCD